MSVFKDQKLFMDVTKQTPSLATTALYFKLINEEHAELEEAWYNFVARDTTHDSMNMHDEPEELAEIIDALMDLIYVSSGMMHAMGVDPQEFWDEVQRSNMSKFTKAECMMCCGAGSMPFSNGDCADCDGEGYVYLVHRRDDGKILKPKSFSPPDLKSILRKYREGQAPKEKNT